MPPLLSSFSEDALVAARDAAPALPRALLSDTLPVDWPTRLAAIGGVALDLDHEVVNAALVKAVHAAGYRMLCYTPNDPVRVAELVAWGVDTVITDAVDAIPAEAT